MKIKKIVPLFLLMINAAFSFSVMGMEGPGHCGKRKVDSISKVADNTRNDDELKDTFMRKRLRAIRAFKRIIGSDSNNSQPDRDIELPSADPDVNVKTSEEMVSVYDWLDQQKKELDDLSSSQLHLENEISTLEEQLTRVQWRAALDLRLLAKYQELQKRYRYLKAECMQHEVACRQLKANCQEAKANCQELETTKQVSDINPLATSPGGQAWKPYCPEPFHHAAESPPRNLSGDELSKLWDTGRALRGILANHFRQIRESRQGQADGETFDPNFMGGVLEILPGDK